MPRKRFGSTQTSGRSARRAAPKGGRRAAKPAPIGNANKSIREKGAGRNRNMK